MEKHAQRNIKVFTEMEAVIEKLGYGSIDFTTDIHGKRITHLSLFGKKRSIYNKSNQEDAYKDIIGRVRQACESKDDMEITFVVKVNKGNIKEALWMTKMTRNYEELDK